MPSYKLIYFNLQARGEVIRWIFAIAKQPYTDERVKFEDWPSLKAATPFGQLPVLEVDGVQICQSAVIADYLARQFGLTGETPLDQARVAMIALCVEDTNKPLFTIRNETDVDKKAALHSNYVEVQLPGFLAKFDALLTSNDGGDGYFVGSKLTYADLAFVNLIGELKNLFNIDADLDKFLKLKALKFRVESDERLAEWLKTRPQPTTLPQKK